MFGRKVKLFKLLGFEVGLDPSWIILAILVAWSLSTGYFPFEVEGLPTQTYWIMGIIGTIGLFVSITAHEFCHSLVARQSGMPMKGITLFIFGGVAEMGDEPPSAKSEFMIAVVGPISSFIMAALFYGLQRYGAAAQWPTQVGGVFGYLGMINLYLAVFNLAPAYPLDGGRILRAALWGWKGNLRWATRICSQIGSGFGVFLIIFGVLQVLGGYFIGGMWLFLIGMFIRGAAKMSYQQLVTRRALEGEHLDRFMTKDPITVQPDLSVSRFVDDYVYRHHHKMYPVTEGEKLLGCVSTEQLKALPRDQWDRKRVSDIAQECSDANTVGPEADAVDALSRMNRGRNGRLLVVREGHLLGIVTLKDMLNFLSLKIELEEA
jgi:Zn-dependent protease/predicted transcriptional regulator